MPRKPKRKETAIHVSWDEIKPTSQTEVFRTNQGAVSIPEVDRNGQYILLENASFKLRKDVFLGKWTLERWITPIRKILFTFPENITLKHEHSCKVRCFRPPFIYRHICSFRTTLVYSEPYLFI